MDEKFLHAAWRKAKEIGIGFFKDLTHILIALAICLLFAFIVF